MTRSTPAVRYAENKKARKSHKAINCGVNDTRNCGKAPRLEKRKNEYFWMVLLYTCDVLDTIYLPERSTGFPRFLTSPFPSSLPASRTSYWSPFVTTRSPLSFDLKKKKRNHQKQSRASNLLRTERTTDRQLHTTHKKTKRLVGRKKKEKKQAKEKDQIAHGETKKKPVLSKLSSRINFWSFLLSALALALAVNGRGWLALYPSPYTRACPPTQRNTPYILDLLLYFDGTQNMQCRTTCL